MEEDSYRMPQDGGAHGIYGNVVYPFLRKVMPRDPLVVYYHLVSDSSVAHIRNLYRFRNVEGFRRSLDALLKDRLPISLSDYLAAMAGGKPVPRNSFMLTFDDGLRECHDVIAPILREKGIPAVFFLCSGFVDNVSLAYDLKRSVLIEAVRQGDRSEPELGQLASLLREAGLGEGAPAEVIGRISYRERAVLDDLAELLGVSFPDYLADQAPYMTSSEVRGLIGEGHAVGAHSIDHPRYCDIPLDEQVRQTLQSLKFVQDEFRIDYAAFAFPSSDRGVSREFFRRIRKEHEDCCFFGNQGMLDDCVDGVVQRCSLESPAKSTAGILGRHMARRLIRQIRREGTVRRS